MWSILTAVGLEQATVQIILDSADAKKTGRIAINEFFDWLYSSPRVRPNSDFDNGNLALSGDVFIATLNFFGNAYNAMEFMNEDGAFAKNYDIIRDAMRGLKSAAVLAEAR